jgi:hypothetical protein
VTSPPDAPLPPPAPPQSPPLTPTPDPQGGWYSELPPQPRSDSTVGFLVVVVLVGLVLGAGFVLFVAYELFITVSTYG